MDANPLSESGEEMRDWYSASRKKNPLADRRKNNGVIGPPHFDVTTVVRR